jgi:RluA family pseudouridine synthase
MKTSSQFTVIYEDKHIIAVNKASGISVGGDRWDDAKERLDRLVGLYLDQKVYTVHRIDRETSGLVLFAKNEAAHRRFSLAFEGRDVAKRYFAVVQGRPLWKETVCDLPLIPNGNKLHMTIIDKYQGKKSCTCFKLLGSAGNYSVLEALPETGRTHQIRVHAAALGFPIVCDSLYGKDNPVLLSVIKKNWRGDLLEEKPLLARLGLHAAELSMLTALVLGESNVESDKNKKILTIKAPIPRDMAALIKQMEKISFSIFF